MCDAGRIRHHLKHNLWREESSVLFVGYQAQESLGRRLLEGVKRVKIMGEDISVKASIYGLDGFSAHADQDQLFDWLSHLKNKPSNVFVVHGEPDMSEPFAQLLQEKLNLTTYIPQYGDLAVIEGTEWQIEKSGALPLESAAVLQIRDYLARLESEFNEYRQRIERLVAADNKKVPDILRRLGKIQAFIKKTFGNL
jgi:metallo-beta-lactamase family protein